MGTRKRDGRLNAIRRYGTLGVRVAELLHWVRLRGTVGLSDGRYIASVISRYRLVDTNRNGLAMSNLLQALLQVVPEFTETAEGAVRTLSALSAFNEFLDADWLDRGAAACQAVCRVETPTMYGTGFLLSRDLVLRSCGVFW